MRNLIKKLSLLLLVIIPLYGCASQIMTSISPVDSINNDKALVTFIISSTLANFGFGQLPRDPGEFDIWDGEKLIGALSRRTYLQYMASPGEHLFVAQGGNWSFVKANLQSGKRYYVFLNIYPLFFRRHGVYLQPVTRKDKDLLASIPSYLNDSKPIAIMKEKYNDYTKKRIDEVKNEIKAFHNSPAEYGFSTLDVEDGL